MVTDDGDSSSAAAAHDYDQMMIMIVSQISVPSEFLNFKSHVERCQPV